jgi:hypothetical protein
VIANRSVQIVCTHLPSCVTPLCAALRIERRMALVDRILASQSSSV